MGMTISALEHRIPELFFTNEEHPGEAVSAVKALAVASAEGQRIYQITSANVGVVNSLNIGQEVKDEIRASVAVGKEATVSQNNITVAGWTGVGYIITDPETGAGAYRISGGGNGAFLGATLAVIGLYLSQFWFLGPMGAILFVMGLGIMAMMSIFLIEDSGFSLNAANDFIAYFLTAVSFAQLAGWLMLSSSAIWFIAIIFTILAVKHFIETYVLTSYSTFHNPLKRPYPYISGDPLLILTFVV